MEVRLISTTSGSPMEQLPDPVDHDGRDICIRNIGLVVLYVLSPSFDLDISRSSTTILPGEATTFRAMNGAWWTVSHSHVLRGARARAQLAQTCNTTTITDLSFDVEDYDTDNFFDTAKPTRLVMPFTGKYAFGGSLSLQADGVGGGLRQLRVEKNGSDILVAGSFPALKVDDTYMLVHGEADFVAGEYIVLSVYQDSGVNLDTTPIGYIASLWTHLLR